jgi:hypothetical protein
VPHFVLLKFYFLLISFWQNTQEFHICIELFTTSDTEAYLRICSNNKKLVKRSHLLLITLFSIDFHRRSQDKSQVWYNDMSTCSNKHSILIESINSHRHDLIEKNQIRSYPINIFKINALLWHHYHQKNHIRNQETIRSFF